MYGISCPACGSDDITEGLNFDWNDLGRVSVPEGEALLTPICNACGAKLDVRTKDPNTEVTVREDKQDG